MKTLDIKAYSAQLQEQLMVRLEAISGENPEIIARSSKCLLAVKEIISDLKDFAYKYEFQSKAEETEFFKETKPVFVSQYYYYDSLITLKINEPITDQERVKLYYRNELKKFQAVVRDNLEFYLYCLSGSTYLDEQYFTRNKTRFKAPDIDTQFSTGYDHILARILANQLIRANVERTIKNLGSEQTGNSPLTWTSKKSYLVELIYALHKVEAFNSGKVDIKQIAAVFEDHFNVPLGNVYKRFQEIGFRKGGQTTFIDQLKEKLEQRFDEKV